jgi:hypothetical protein
MPVPATDLCEPVHACVHVLLGQLSASSTHSCRHEDQNSSSSRCRKHQYMSTCTATHNRQLAALPRAIPRFAALDKLLSVHQIMPPAPFNVPQHHNLSVTLHAHAYKQHQIIVLQAPLSCASFKLSATQHHTLHPLSHCKPKHTQDDG